MRSKKRAATPLPRVMRSQSNHVPIAEVIDSEKKPAAVKSPVESGRKKIVINNVDSDDDDDDDDDDKEEVINVPIWCDWGPVKCYFDGSYHNNYMKPLPCRRSGSRMMRSEDNCLFLFAASAPTGYYYEPRHIYYLGSPNLY